MTSVNDILAEREKTHGSYAEHAEISNVVFEFWASRPGYKNLTHDQRETLKMIAHKAGRVLAGNAEFADHWDDVAGYATLSANLVRARAMKLSEAPEPTDPFKRAVLWPEHIYTFVFETTSSTNDRRSLYDYINGVKDNTGEFPKLSEVLDYRSKLRHAEPT